MTAEASVVVHGAVRPELTGVMAHCSSRLDHTPGNSKKLKLPCTWVTSVTVSASTL